MPYKPPTGEVRSKEEEGSRRTRTSKKAKKYRKNDAMTRDRNDERKEIIVIKRHNGSRIQNIPVANRIISDGE